MTKEEAMQAAETAALMGAVRARRVALGWSVVQLMEAAGLGEVAYQHDRGIRVPTVDTLGRYAAALGGRFVARVVPAGAGAGVPNAATRRYIQAVGGAVVAAAAEHAPTCPACGSVRVGAFNTGSGSAGGCMDCGAEW